MAKLVIVDDSPVIAMLLNKVLTDCGHEVIAKGKDGNEGVKLFKEKKPDLIILDVTMPNKSGKECLEEILKVDQSAKVIMFSSLSDQETAQECLEIGAKAFIKKTIDITDPSTQNEIIEKITEVLEAA